MANKTSETLAFLAERILKSNERVAKAVHEGNYEQIVRSSYSLTISHMTVGLIRWRQSENPCQNFAELVKGLIENLSALQMINPKQDAATKLDLHYTSYLAFLLNRPHPPVSLEALNEHLIVRGFIGNVLIGADDISNWPKYSKALPDTKRFALARQTYDLYARLLAGQIAPEEGVKLGDELYGQRKTDPYYVDSTIEGGGEDNEAVVDFRLGAILKKIGSDVPTIHAWKW